MNEQHRVAELEKRVDNIEQCMSAMRTELTENTTTTRKIADDTAFIRATWAEGVAVVRLGCRLAAAWRFLLKQVFLPIGLPMLALYGIWYYTEFHRFPAWLADSFKFLMAVL